MQAVFLFPRTKKDYCTSNRAAGLPQGMPGVLQRRRKPPWRHGKFGEPEVARIGRELILRAASMPRPAVKAAGYNCKPEGLGPLRHLPCDCLTIQGLPMGQVYFLWHAFPLPALPAPPCLESVLTLRGFRLEPGGHAGPSMDKAYQLPKRTSRSISGWLLAIHCPGPVSSMGSRAFMFLFPSG